MASQSRAYRLLGILKEHAPNGAAQEACTNLYHKVSMDGGSDLDLEKAMAGALTDGLNYGNWPWNMPPKVRAICPDGDPECAVDHSVTVRPK